MRRVVTAVLFLTLTIGLAVAADATADLKSADQGWSKASQAKNIDQFMSFVGADVYACGLDGKWTRGSAAMRDEWSKLFADPSFKLSWSVDTAEVSKDGRMGYTRGTFQGGMGGKALSGSYATVWKKDKDGKWQVVVDIASAAP